MQRLSALIASSEIAPYAKTGGLGEVAGSLPGALAAIGVRTSLVMPAYRSVLDGGFPVSRTGARFAVPISGRQEEGTILETTTPDGLNLRLVRADRYFGREGLYGTPDGDYPDNAERFVFFCRAILEAMRHDPPQISTSMTGKPPWQLRSSSASPGCIRSSLR